VNDHDAHLDQWTLVEERKRPSWRDPSPQPRRQRKGWFRRLLDKLLRR
jgi:hypothetical protein